MNIPSDLLLNDDYSNGGFFLSMNEPPLNLTPQYLYQIILRLMNNYSFYSSSVKNVFLGNISKFTPQRLKLFDAN